MGKRRAHTTYIGQAFYHPNADDPNGTSNHPGGHFIAGDVRDFDHAFFQFSKSQAAAIDPQQRLLMELAYEALESGGIPRESVAGTATSVYTAIFPTDYNNHLYRDLQDLPTYYMTGVEMAIFSNRLSHVFDLRGPSMTLDTACSGGLVALHEACQSLRNRDSDASFVAASNLTLGPDHFIGLSNLHMLSSTGRCYPFDERGKGYGRGEGVVVLVLKRLDDAIWNRDPVRAVIRNTGIGQDGYTPQSITYPNGQAQADLARTTYARAGLRPEDVAFVEAHGTGTKAGDPEELEGIADVFAGTERSLPLYVGSTKGAIGHTEAVAGLASFLKAAAMLDHEMIPPVAGFAKPKSGLPLDRMIIPTEVVPWPHATGVTPRISINSFGFGGAIAHAILEKGSYPSVGASVYHAASPRLFTLSANSPTSLKTMIRGHHGWVERRMETPLADLSYTLLHRRSALPYRFSAVAKDHDSLLEALNQGLAMPTTKQAPAELDIVMVFTGQGAVWAGMGRELLMDTTTPSSVFRSSIRTSRDMLRQLGVTWDLEVELLRDDSESRLHEAELAQPVTTATQIALLSLLRAQGVQPHAVVGHSSGEIAAAYAVGHLPHSTAMKVAFHRGCMAAAVKTKGMGPGTMLSVGLGEADAAKYLEGLTRGKAVVACINSPRSVTISGDADAVNEVEAHITTLNDGTFHRKLPVDAAYHSHHMRAVADDYRRRLGILDINNSVATKDEGVDFFSSVSGQPKTSGFDADYWITNFVSPVRFSDAVQALAKVRFQTNRHVAFVEIGGHPALSGPVRQCLQQPDMPKCSFDYHSVLQRKTDAISSALGLAGKLFERGVRLQWHAVSGLSIGTETAVVRHDLPAYPWDHSTKHWYESRVAQAFRLRKEPYHDLLGLLVLDGTDLEPRWRHFLSKATMPWLADHVVDGLAVFPGAGYLCMAIEGVAQLARQDFSHRSLETLALRDVSFKRGLVIPDGQRVELQLSFKPLADSSLTFQFSITALSDGGEWYEHATGVVEGVLAEQDAVTEAPRETLRMMPTNSDTTSKDALYQGMNAAGNTYGPTFAGLHSITMAAEASQAISSFDVLDLQASMPAKYQRPHVIHPSTLDIVFQTALPLVGRRLGPGSIMPVHIDELLIGTVPRLHEPGSHLDVSVLLTSSHFRTAISDLCVLSSGNRVLTISGMEFRSLGPRSEEAGDAMGATSPVHEFCYELDWHNSINYVRAKDLPETPALADLIAQTVLSQFGQSILGLGASVDLTDEFLGAVGNHNKVVSHDFVDATPGRFDDAARRFKGIPMQFRTLRPGANPIARGFQAGTYDIVLAASAKWLDHAALLVKPSGIVLLVVSGNDGQNGARPANFQRTPMLEEQLTFRDNARDRLVVLAKAAEIPLSSKIHILTHSACDAPLWVRAVKDRMIGSNVDVSLDTLNLDTVEALHSSGALDSGSSDTVVIVDDMPSLPILTDTNTFNAAIALLKQPARLVWLSPDNPASFHQIEGVARTAHAENDKLRLITIHAASSQLADQLCHERLVNVVFDATNQVAGTRTAHVEREYRIRKDGAVVVPRLHHSDKLNHAVINDGSLGPKTDTHRFSDDHRPLMLSSDGSALFVEDEKACTTSLANDAIEVKVQAAVLPKLGFTASMEAYAGVIGRVGADVESLVINDRVVVLAPMVGANRLLVPQTGAARIPSDMLSTTACALLPHVMAAVHALRGVARLLSSGGSVLVHGARTAAGRAVIAVARSIGVRVTATAADLADARQMENQLGIDAADLLVGRRSLHRRSPHEVFADGLDVVIQASENHMPTEALAHIKPFGSIIVLGYSSATAIAPKLPSNVAFHFVDIAGLIKARPDLISTLITEAATVLKLVPLAGLEIPVRDIAETAEALRLVNTGVYSKVVLQVDPESTVQVVPAAKSDPWTDEAATYVVAGGLGDIGQRLLALMAQRGAKHLATISRRTVNAHTHHTLQANLEAIRPGVRLYMIQGDVSSESSVQAAAAALSKQGAPPVRGIVQAATFMNVWHLLLF